jgi:hypothetical protein
MKTHTPGPWKFAAAVQNNGPNYFAVTTGKWGAPTIATCWTEPDARLCAAAPAMLAVIERAYTHLGDNRNQWAGRHTPEGQALLIGLRDTIAAATGRGAQDVQDDYCNRNLSQGGEA